VSRSSWAALAVAVVSVALAVPAAVAAPPPSNVIYGKDVPVIPMAEWEVVQQGAAEQTGARILIAAGDRELARAPATAARYDSQTFGFPGGDLRVLRFRKAGGGVLHQVTSETQYYVVAGSAIAEVAGAKTRIAAGDVVNLPSGVLRSDPKAVEDTTVLAFTVDSAVANPRAAVVRAKDTPSVPLAAGPKAGQGSARVSVRRYAFDGNSIRVATLKGRGTTAPATPAVDVVVYMVSGRMQITIGDEVRIVSAGDALREEAGKPASWDVLEDSVFVATNAPLRRAPQEKKP
jgi:quercetin dioxygenase-like cupin family protein